jgi:hypothetical protein
MRHMIPPLLTAIAVTACGQQGPADLSTALRGMSKSEFLSCAGPPMLEYAQAGLDRMSFVTNLKRGQPIGIAGPLAGPAESCSVDATFERDRLVTSSFSGNIGMCDLVFSPCLPK